MCDKQIHKYKYTNTQIQFGSNLQIDLMFYIFEKVMVRGPQKQCSQVSDIQVHKYKNTQIQFVSNLQIDLSMSKYEYEYYGTTAL